MKKLIFTIISLALLAGSLHIRVQYLGAKANIDPTVTANVQVHSKTNLVAYWNMDENDKFGVTFYDKSGFNNHATSTAGVITGIGKLRQAVDFNGTSDRMEVLDDSTLDFGTGPLTMSAWIYMDDAVLTQHASIMEKGDDTEVSGEWVFQVLNNAASNYINFRSNGINSFIGVTPVTKGAWHHVAAVKVGTTMYGYVDGALDGSGSNTDTLTNTETLRIGWRSNAYNGYFNGRIDELKIWKRAFSAAEIRDLYNNTKTTFIR